METTAKLNQGWFAKAVHWFRETTRDRTMERLCASLVDMGIEARIRPSDFPETSPKSGGTGIIEILKSPIRWINVWETEEQSAEGGTYTVKHMDCEIPGAGSPKLGIRSIRVRTFPLLGKVIDVRWKGDDEGTGVVKTLSSDKLIRDAIINSGLEISITGRDDSWRIPRWIVEAPTIAEWKCYELIAERLLGNRVTGAKGDL